MRHANHALIAVVGILLGVVGTLVLAKPLPTNFLHHDQLAASTGSNDRYQDYIMCTGAVAVTPRAPTDGVWMLDYRSGKLLATVIDRTVGKIVGWAELDLVTEFNIPPKHDVHFMMTTGTIAQGQAALYVAEVTTGKFGIYTMGPAPTTGGVLIRRHDMTTFRAEKKP
jgi:hypothetical protein